jgi:deoxycytidylate deaminase
MNNSNILNTLRTEANKSLIDQQLAAAIIKGKRLITKPCCNTTRSTCRGNCIGSLHAEANAIINYFGRSLSFDKKKGWILDNRVKSKLDLVVVRVNKLGEICNSRPCHNCLNMMKSVGIRRVYYSVGSEMVICENVKDMISIQSSSVDKYLELLNHSDYKDHNTYYENLLIKYFPSSIRKYNLDNFILYNLSHLLPKHRVVIQTNNLTTYVWITDSQDKEIIKATVLI